MNCFRISKFNFVVLSAFLFLRLCAAAFAQQSSANPVNLNTASAAELQTLPGIGPKLAAAIIEHRRKHGFFKRPQDIIIIRGMSAKRFRPIAHLLATQPANTEDAK